MEDYFCIKPTGGLCNRLRVIFSWNDYAKKQQKKLIVFWSVTCECPGVFTSHFDNVPNMEFVEYTVAGKAISSTADISKWGRLSSLDYIGHDQKDGYDRHNMQTVYGDLKCNGRLKKSIDAYKSQFKEFVGIHIRRTDFFPPAKLYMDDSDYMNFVNNYPEQNIFLATDNHVTQLKFLSRYTTRLKTNGIIGEGRKTLRKTNLEHSIIDLFMCVEATHFCGAKWSSFSELIYDLRKEPRPEY